MSWTPQIEKAARELWVLNQSAGDVAQTLNARFGTRFTRNSIIGKAFRRGWSERRGPDAPKFGCGSKGVWTEERVATLRRLIDADMTYADIAESMGEGFTYGMVAGKVKRLGWGAEKGSLDHIAKQIRSAAVARRKRGGDAPAVAPAWKPPVVFGVTGRPAEEKAPPPVVVDLGSAVSLIALQAGQCKWVVQEDPEFLFCARPVAALSCYCAGHTRMGLSPDGRRQRAERLAAVRQQAARVARPFVDVAEPAPAAETLDAGLTMRSAA